MAGASGTSIWLQRARARIENSQEWEEFVGRLLEAVHQQMAESHVSAFLDLSRAEKAFVLQKAAKAIQGGDSYKALMSQVSSCLEEQIYVQIAQEMQGGEGVKNKMALLLRHLKDGAVTILEQRPDLKEQLRCLFNQPLPADLRSLTWRLYLSNAKARLQYLSQRTMNKTTSLKDREIFWRCQALLDSEPTFQSLRGNNVAAKCLRNVLSYYHKLQGMSTPLCEQDYLLPVPLLQVILDVATPSISVDTVSTLLVEEFLTLMKQQPWLPRPSTTQDPIHASTVEEVASLLKQLDRDLVRSLESIYFRSEGDSKEALLKGVRHMLQPAICTLFVGYLSKETLLYIWDQIILGIEQPSYNCIPVFATIFILLLRDQLLSCQSPAELEAIVKTQGAVLSVPAFQDMVGKHFFEELYSQLCSDSNRPFPIHDPTQALPPWSYRGPQIAAPPRTRPEDRRKTRLERDLLQRQHMERMEQEDKLRRSREEEDKRQREIQFLQLLEETEKKFEMQKVHLENQLTQERQFCYEMQTKAEEQIGELQAEINRLRERKMPSLDTCSAGSLLAPAPSPQSQMSLETSQPLHFLAETDNRHITSNREGQTARTFTLELLKWMMEAASAMVNGQSTEEQESLDTTTRKHLQNYKQDYKNAKIELFGYEISEEELEDISEHRRKTLKEKLEGILRRGAEAHYKAQLAARNLPGSIIYRGLL
ncbi:hypothetical protein lerEdw1_002665 [Lerista edwardsae]|nr:hypothetical protein lerEdw1_002665 [Lerista edwardsae]